MQTDQLTCSFAWFANASQRMGPRPLHFLSDFETLSVISATKSKCRTRIAIAAENDKWNVKNRRVTSKTSPDWTNRRPKLRTWADQWLLKEIFDRAHALPPFFFLCVFFSFVLFMMRMATQKKEVLLCWVQKSERIIFLLLISTSISYDCQAFRERAHATGIENDSWNKKRTETDMRKQRNNCNSASCTADCTTRRTISRTAGWFRSLIKN